jgi:TPR repeat protein
MCYANGEGVTQDPREAFKWFPKAAEHGNAGAERD